MIFLDGPTGSELTRRGVDTKGDAWSARSIDVAPGVLARIHAEYTESGCSHVRANTFRTRHRTVGARWRELASAAVDLARLARPRVLLGSIGPLFDCYRPDLSPGETSRAEHRALAEHLAPRVDGFVCEAFPAALEAAVAVEECVRAGKPTWVSLTAGPSGDLMTPASMRDGAKRAVDAGASAVLVNCVAATKTLPYVEALSGIGVPVGAYANAAEWYGPKVGPDDYAALARGWAAAGAEIVGACCGTGPEWIRAVVEGLRTLR